MALVTFYFDVSLLQLGPSGHLSPTCPFSFLKPSGQVLDQKPVTIAHHRCLQGPASSRSLPCCQSSGLFLSSLTWNLNSYLWNSSLV